MTIPNRPSSFCNQERCEEILEELRESRANLFVLVGGIPIKQFLNKGAQVDYSTLQEYVDIYGYGNSFEAVIDNRTIDILPLAPPRQIGE